jgi:glycosyltransferase involved in cell wall biosynthesis
MERTKQGLEQLGVEVTIDLECKEELSKYDLVHLFNLATPDYTRVLAQRAKAAGVPFVVTTLLEDVQNFHNQSHAWAQYLYNYVQNGQSKEWAAINKPDLSLVQPSQRFENSWTIQNAAGLFVTGPKEGQVISRDYGNNLPIYSIYLGCEVSEGISADKFSQAYGIKDFVLCVGRIESRKNQLSLLKALEEVDVPVVIAGSGFTYQPGYAEAVKNFKRKAPTLVLGRLDKEMLASAYCAAKVHACIHTRVICGRNLCSSRCLLIARPYAL